MNLTLHGLLASKVHPQEEMLYKFKHHFILQSCNCNVVIIWRNLSLIYTFTFSTLPCLMGSDPERSWIISIWSAFNGRVCNQELMRILNERHGSILEKANVIIFFMCMIAQFTF